MDLPTARVEVTGITVNLAGITGIITARVAVITILNTDRRTDMTSSQCTGPVAGITTIRTVRPIAPVLGRCVRLTAIITAIVILCRSLMDSIARFPLRGGTT